MILFTIGHSNRSFDDFVNLLKNNNIKILIDVRSYPYSKYVTHFDRENLESSLKNHSMSYEYQGKNLGGRPPEGFDNYRKTSYYTNVLNNLIDYILDNQSVTALMCSEKDYTKCHRRFLAEDLQKIIDKENISIEIFHIISIDTIVSNISEKQKDNPTIEDYFAKEDTKVIQDNKEDIQTIKTIDDTNIPNKKKKGKKKKEKNTEKDLKLI